MGTARKKMVDNAMARAKIYGLLATIFRAEPTEALIKQLKSSNLAEVLSSMGLSLGDDFAETPPPTLAEELAVEYTKLFIGPGSHISPFESIFAEAAGGGGGLWGEATVKVKKFIESAGFKYQSEFTGLPDHIGAELEFMQKSAEAEADLWSAGEAEKASWCLRMQRKFIDEHLGRWAPKFCDEVIKTARLPFYAEIAALTKDFLQFDRQIVDEQIAEAA